MARGWGGNPPRDDNEARERIIAAAMRCIDRHGPHKTALSDVATELGVTRQTVYRLYPSVDDLLIAVGISAADDFLNRLADHVADLSTPADIVVESIAYTYERLPREPYLGLLLTTGRAETFIKAATSAEAMAFGRSMVARMHIDWTQLGIDNDDLDDLVEFGLRILQTLVVDPPTSRTPGQLRLFLHRCVAPAFSMVTASPGYPRRRQT